jgi:hypothetical protein
VIDRSSPPTSVARSWFARAATLAVAFAGSALAMVFVSSVSSAIGVAIAAALFTALYATRDLTRSDRRFRRTLGVLGHVSIIAFYILFIYLAIAWGSLLYWSVRWWGWTFVAVAAAGAMATARPVRGFRVPAVLPIGAWIALCLLGWRREERILRCDDYLTLSPRLTLVTATRDVSECRPNDELVIGPYPRVIWESPDADRLIVTTQDAVGGHPPAGARFQGSVCEVRGDATPTCFGVGKAQGVAESEPLDRVFIANWGRMPNGDRGQLFAVPRDGPFEAVATVNTRGSLGELFYDAAADRIYGFTDEGFEALPFVASTLTPEPSIDVPLLPPGAIRYDGDRGEGILCAAALVTELEGSGYIAVAIRGHPFSVRPLGHDSLLSHTALTWGCDWDPSTRRAYVAIPNLGLLATVDYDSGEVLGTGFIGFGARSVTIDRPRGRLYITNFLGGYVSALDLESLEQTDAWQVGRFPRFATLSRDGDTLFVGTTLGVVAIAL